MDGEDVPSSSDYDCLNGVQQSLWQKALERLEPHNIYVQTPVQLYSGSNLHPERVPPTPQRLDYVRTQVSEPTGH